MKGSLVILMFFVLGVVVSRLGWLPSEVDIALMSKFVLWGLMLFVGISLGSDPHLARVVKSIHAKMLLLPLMTIVGTLLGSLLVSGLIGRYSISECMAVGSGFGYYSLSSIFIGEYKGAELGAVALMANIFRELITLLGAPLLVKMFGPMALISSGGATTMDTTLPTITRYSGKEFVFIAIFHGILVDLTVPFWVTLFCSL